MHEHVERERATPAAKAGRARTGITRASVSRTPADGERQGGLLHPITPVVPVETRIRRSPLAVIRRKTLENLRVKDSDVPLHTAWGLAITKTAGADSADATRPITEQKELAGGKDARIYGDTAPLAKAASKPAALKSAATRAGFVGQQMQEWAKANWATIRNGQEKFEPKQIFNIGEADPNKIDPWVHKVVVPYTGGGEQTLTMEFQHTKGFDGYVCKVADTGNADLNKERVGRPRAGSRGAAMYMGKGAKEISASGPHIKGNADFSNLHDQTEASEGRNLLELTAGAGHVAADAYTKLAGEGARFMCVRDNMSKLRNDSYFYYEHEGQKWGITFAQLWINWEKKFDKAYNIANATIVAKMKAAASLRTALPAVDDARDVKLD